MVDQIEEHNMTTQFDETLLRKHCEKSWQATRWLLEIKCPERYGKPKKNAPSGPDVAEVLSTVIDVVAEEVADDALRARIAARLDTLATGKSADTPRRSSQRKADQRAAKSTTQATAQAPTVQLSKNPACEQRACGAANEPQRARSSDQLIPVAAATCPATEGVARPSPARKSMPPAFQAFLAQQAALP
jgi:hypothetical protein